MAATTLSKFGTGFPTTLEVFSAMAGKTFWTKSNFSLTFALFFCFLRCLARVLALFLSARTISFFISGISAIASLASEVNGIFVEATWIKIMAGPLGVPFPPFCSSPYSLQLILCTAFVIAQPPAW